MKNKIKIQKKLNIFYDSLESWNPNNGMSSMLRKQLMKELKILIEDVQKM